MAVEAQQFAIMLVYLICFVVTILAKRRTLTYITKVDANKDKNLIYFL